MRKQKQACGLLAITLSLIMVITLIPAYAFGAEAGADEGERHEKRSAVDQLESNTGYYEDEYWYDDEEYDTYDGEVHLKVIGSRAIKVYWDYDTSNDIDHIKIYRKKSGHSWKHVKTVGEGQFSWKDRNLSKKTKYYYKLKVYFADGKIVTGDSKSVKTRPNVGYLGSSDDYGEYGDVTYEQVKVWYYKGKLRCGIKLYNERYFNAKKFKRITIKIYDRNGDLIGKQSFRNVYLGMKPYTKKWKTFKFTYGNTYKHNVNLRYDADDYYMDYDILWTY